MISIRELQSRLVDKWVVFDSEGSALGMDIPGDVGPAALLVAPVTEALKEVDEDGRVVASVDRSRMWSVRAFLLNEIALRRLEGQFSAGDLIEAVRESGLAWSVRPISDP